MHRIFKYFSCAVIALAGISCDKVQNTPINVTELDTPEILFARMPELSTKSVTKGSALREFKPEVWDGEEMIDTRSYAVIDATTVDPNSGEAKEYFQYWSEGDEISLFVTSYNQKYGLQSIGENKDEAQFELVGSEGIGDELYTDYYYSVYPYKEDTEIFWFDGKVTYNFPEHQTYNKELNGDSYANGENAMIAREPKNDADWLLYYQNFCSYLQLRLASEELITKKVKKICLISNNLNDKMSGPCEILFNDSEPVVSVLSGNKTSNFITLYCNDGVLLSNDANNPSKFWFVIPGGFTFSEGFTCVVTFDDNSYFKQSTSKSISIQRNHIKPMATLKPELNDPTGPIRYKYHDTSIMEPYTLNHTFLDENGLPLDIIGQIYDEETSEWVVLLSGTLKTIYDNSFREAGPDIEYIKVVNDDNPVILRDYSFYNCSADSLMIYSPVESIRESAFTGSKIKDLNIYNNVTIINESAGTGSKIENILIKGDVTTIQQNAFNGCLSLQTLKVNSVETIEYRAFYNCTNLTTAIIPGVTTLGMGAFRGCSSLQEIDLKSVVTISDNAFMDCSSLTFAEIGSACTFIGEGAFCNNTSLMTVNCYAVEPPFISTDNEDSSYVFDNVNKNIVIYIPKGSFANYYNDKYFGNKKNWWMEYYKLIKQGL